uniref:ZP domain-containing protein n=1 Tax=Romanomermis culicivorax TaxID=13658 RepID=A0A915JQ88_ROMCU
MIPFFSILVIAQIGLIFGIPIDNGVEGDPEVECGASSVSINFNTKNAFQGHIYAKGYFNDTECRSDAEIANSRKTASLNISFAKCGTERARSLNPKGVYVRQAVVISFHPQFLTKVDRAYLIQCFYMVSRESHVFKYADKAFLQFFCQISLTIKDPGAQCPKPRCKLPGSILRADADAKASGAGSSSNVNDVAVNKNITKFLVKNSEKKAAPDNVETKNSLVDGRLFSNNNNRKWWQMRRQRRRAGNEDDNDDHDNDDDDTFREIGVWDVKAQLPMISDLDEVNGAGFLDRKPSLRHPKAYCYIINFYAIVCAIISSSLLLPLLFCLYIVMSNK